MAKLESFNPLGSVKDRIGVAMIVNAEERGSSKRTRLLLGPPAVILASPWPLSALPEATGSFSLAAQPPLSSSFRLPRQSLSNSIEIHPGARIDRRFFIDHGAG